MRTIRPHGDADKFIYAAERVGYGIDSWWLTEENAAKRIESVKEERPGRWVIRATPLGEELRYIDDGIN